MDQFIYFSTLISRTDQYYFPLYTNTKISILVTLSLFMVFVCINIPQAQDLGGQWLDLKGLDIQTHLPKYLLSRKSVVFLSVPRSASDPNLRADWKKLSAQVHKSFKKMKVDAIGYYYLDDLLGNSDINLSFLSEMKLREIKYIIVVDQSPRNAVGVGAFTITITAFNKKTSFISDGQKAWESKGPNLKVLLNDMRKDVYRAEMELENYLIPDFPEFFTDAKILKGKRIPTYATDLKVEKLVVPKFRRYEVEDSTKLDGETKQKIALYNSMIDQKNNRLEQIMNSYPLKYEFSESALDDDIYRQGDQFVLLMIYGSGKSIKDILNFIVDPYETGYVTIKSSEIGSTLMTLPVDAVVHKYYVKHVYTKDVYVGSRWDADLTWEEALQNFIFHTKDVLKLKKKK